MREGAQNVTKVTSSHSHLSKFDPLVCLPRELLKGFVLYGSIEQLTT